MDIRQSAFWSRRAGALTAALAVALSFIADPATAADPNLAVNGSFATTSTKSTEFGSTNNGYTPPVQLTGWSTAGYNFVYLPNTIDTTGAISQYNTTATLASPGIRMWGPNDGGPANGLPQASPTGGNFIAADGAYEVSAITQTITGLHVGAKVYVSFAWAGAQQSGFTGPTTDNWTVDLGSSPSQTTPTVSLASEGATAWMNQTFSFIATSSSEVLSFLATGTPTGQPPFALLANVVVTAPEPASVVLMLSGMAGLLVVARHRRTRAVTAIA
ncbi:MAG TPA: PEP-CTERM sorting domain-containing protein [Acetobacteraceae bacterium]|jgi:hypothetical protein|nr:PEP-CTERM sorting domain-containing protein [Acetobacteraceae bacterium]